LIQREDGAQDKWEEAYGKRNVYIAASSEDIRLTGIIEAGPKVGGSTSGIRPGNSPPSKSSMA
jgi:hypothetical protein